MQNETENEVLIRIAQSDEAAFKLLFDSYSNKVFGYALKICQSATQAEEIVQNVFMNIWINRIKLAQIDNLSAYVRIMARNEALQFIRRLAMENRHQAIIAQTWSEQYSDTEVTVNYNEANKLLHETLNSLPPQQKLVYHMCHLQGMKQHEVALELHISPLTVKSHLRQAVVKIRKAMLELVIVLFSVVHMFIGYL